MKILISGVCGFVGSTLARDLTAAGHQVYGFDNFIRPGSERNRALLQQLGIQLFHADLRLASDLESLPKCEWVLDAAANPSVLAGIDGKTSSRQLVEHNLGGTVNLLEYCKLHQAGFTLLSTSRVYSIAPLAALSVEVASHAFHPASGASLPAGLTQQGIDETFTTAAPISLYGATKLASEALALEYGQAFSFPVFINRCGVLAGAGQFGRADQGIFSYWIHSWRQKRPLRYLGFDGQGHQVRDCLHPSDLLPLLESQFKAGDRPVHDRLIHVSGGSASACSLRQLSQWCEGRFGPHTVVSDLTPRAFDIPWIILDPGKAERLWGWTPQKSLEEILIEIAEHAETNHDWLDISAPY